MTRLARPWRVSRDPRFVDVTRRLAGAGRHRELVALLEPDHQRTGVHQRAGTLDDEVKQDLQVRLRADRAGDGRGRLQSAIRPLERIASRGFGAIESRVLHRDGSPGGEDHDRLLIGLVEVAVGLVGQVEIAERLVANEDRHPEEAAHLRMSGREAVRLRVLADVRKPERLGVLDQQPQDSAAARQVADCPMTLRLDAAGDEALELDAPLVEYAERGVARPGHAAGDVEQLTDNPVDVEHGDEPAAGLDELPQSRGIE